jgi:G3E family GTPase
MIPITLVTGFLGSGKSTLINHVLKKSNKRIGLLVNEFGDVALESQIIEANNNEPIIELNNGCMCCVVREDIIKSLEMLLEKDPTIEHIIVEASGLSDPIPIASTFLSNNLNGRVQFDAIITTVDSLNLRFSAEDFGVVLTQIKYADYVILTKTKLAEEKQIEETYKTIRNFSEHAKVFKDSEEIPLEVLFDINTLNHCDIEKMAINDHHEDTKHHVHHHHHDHFDSIFYKTKNPFDPIKLQDFINNLPETVYRVKGFVRLEDEKIPDRKWKIQVVSFRKQVFPGEWKENEERQSAILFIGKSFDKEYVREKLQNAEITSKNLK